MIRFLLCTTLTSIFSAAVLTAPMDAQAAKAGSSWQHVQALPLGTDLDVKARTGNKHCYFKSADAETFTCVGKKSIVFQASDIKSIRLRHRGRSALIGAAVGAGIGAGAAAAEWKPTWWPFSRSGVAVIVAIPFGLTGALIANYTDFTGSTIYRAE